MCIDCVTDAVKEQSSMFNGDSSFTYCQDLSGCMLALGLLWVCLLVWLLPQGTWPPCFKNRLFVCGV